MIDKPKLRPVEAIPVQYSGKQMIALRDPARVAPDPILISGELLFILQFFDGRHTRLDIKNQFFKEFGTFLYEDKLNSIIQDLDDKLFLDSENFFEYERNLKIEYRKSKTRASMLAGNSYPAEPEALEQELTRFFTHPEGPGLPGSQTRRKQVKGIIAPHIDIKAGGITFAHAYRALAEAAPIELFLILGTGHNVIQNLFACTDKNFETPLGEVQTDLEFLNRLQQRVSFDLFSEELCHKNEHTIEFQTVFLQFILNRQVNWKIVPILCSFNTAMLGKSAPTAPHIQTFLTALHETIHQYQKKTCIIASADLAHVGRRYGDNFEPTPGFLTDIKKADLDTLAHVEKLETDKFIRAVAADDVQRRICGFPPIYSLLKIIEAEEGKLLHYNQAAVDNYNSTVSFASMVFY